MQRNSLQNFLRNIMGGRTLRQMRDFINMARDFGLPEFDIENAKTSLDCNESEIAFDIIAQQMYEYNIKIDKEFYDLAMSICDTLKIEKQKYHFLNELIVY